LVELINEVLVLKVSSACRKSRWKSDFRHLHWFWKRTLWCCYLLPLWQHYR